MRLRTNSTTGSLLVAVLLALPSLIQAQPTAHYAPGLEGLKAATLPPPGIWFRDYNQFYYADQVNDSKGDKIGAADAKAYIYANAPRLLWITDTKLLDGYLGVDALIPLFYKELDVKPGPGAHYHDNTTGLGDLFFEGSWSWHLKQWDLALAAGVWAPTGNFSENNPTSPGNGYWGEMLTAGFTWYPDQEKRWSFSALNRYEFNQEQKDTDVTPGQAYTVEGGIGYGLTKTIDVGPIGYFQQQVNADKGGGSSNRRDRVAGIGPEASVFFPKYMLGISFRYAYEFLADNRLQGNTFTLTLTKKF